jgi:ATP-binding cassette, subfamily F, member 3
VATHVIEVRTGRVASYPGSFDEYVYRVQSEIDSGLRAPHTVAAHAGTPTAIASTADRKAQARAGRDAQKRLKTVERKIARFDDEKRQLGERLLTVTSKADAQRLQAELAALTAELATLEEEWLELSSEEESG